MLRVISFLTLLSCGLTAALYLSNTKLSGRIVNGKDTSIQLHPYQVSVQVKGYRSTHEHICGGSLISERFVITAAHCVIYKKLADITAYIGSSLHNAGGLRIQVLQKIVHERYDEWVMTNDVALLKLSAKVEKSSTTNFISLSQETPTTNTSAVVTGWGNTCFQRCPSPAILQQVDVYTISTFDCNSISYRYNGEIRAGMLCAKGDKKDSCQGDSGGPLVSDGKLIGISSWGVGCAEPEYPGVYTDVAYFREWILKAMA